ncbi:MAG: hypothetical protein JSS96_03530 [Bacteroidetes bacterium]|nr:hypothetical protein [Bacteroidota bacterium]
MYEVIATNIDVKNAVLKTLQYYALFSYPLKASEIHGSCSQQCSTEALLQAIEDLLTEKKVYKYNDFYSVQPNIEYLTERRKKGNEIAQKKYAKAVKAGRIINSFPFVRFVGISGSISKGYAEANSDFDFFIITENNRLWICRSLLHLFKKATFLVGAQHRFCMNYFIDTSKLELEERNIFTATELASIIPLHGSSLYRELNIKNKWQHQYFPNGYMPFVSTGSIDDGRSFLKKLCESFINILRPEQLNKRLMQITDTRWRNKWSKKNYPMADYELAFKTTLHVSKNHPANHQKRVLAKLSTLNSNCI